MQLNYLNKPHFENGAIKSISQVLEEHGIKNPLIYDKDFQIYIDEKSYWFDDFECPENKDCIGTKIIYFRGYVETPVRFYDFNFGYFDKTIGSKEFFIFFR